MRAGMVTASLIGALACSGCAGPSNPEAEQAAVEAALAWVALVDDGKYATSWDQAAEYFRSAVRKEDWEQMIRAVRNPLGKNTSREVKVSRYKTALPGAPDGEYVVIQFSSSFENKKVAIETVTPMLDKDGAWRTSGYNIN